MDEERSIIERAKKDPEAFGLLFEQQYPAIFGYVFRRVGDWTVSKDITSEVFLKAHKSLWRYRWQESHFHPGFIASQRTRYRCFSEKVDHRSFRCISS